MSNWLSKISFSSLLHFCQYHGRNFFSSKYLFSLGSVQNDMGFASFFNNFKWEVFDVMLYSRIGPFSSNQSFGIKYSILRIGSELIFGSITNETFSLSGKSNIRWCDSVSLIIGNDFNTSVFENSDTTEWKIMNLSWTNNRGRHNHHTYQEYVVPKSMPITVPRSSLSSLAEIIAATDSKTIRLIFIWKIQHICT